MRVCLDRSPDGGKGLARDTRIRWALEEVGQPYKVCLVSFRAMKEPAHLTLHPFGQIPTYEEGDLVLFETGARFQGRGLIVRWIPVSSTGMTKNGDFAQIDSAPLGAAIQIIGAVVNFTAKANV